MQTRLHTRAHINTPPITHTTTCGVTVGSQWSGEMLSSHSRPVGSTRGCLVCVYVYGWVNQGVSGVCVCVWLWVREILSSHSRPVGWVNHWVPGVCV